MIEVAANGTLRVELKNGHRLTAYVPRKMKTDAAAIQAGDTVKLQLTPCDLSVGRVIETNKT
ncbi:MAG: translation initiation factor IF-1 [Verrucomicrobiota bacterium]|nr:translation initiation factor IF-1 [Verrucomicrobiota bacterium]